MEEIYSKDELTNEFILLAIKEHDIEYADLKEMSPSMLLSVIIERVGQKQAQAVKNN